jgi:hypothetical protein
MRVFKYLSGNEAQNRDCQTLMLEVLMLRCAIKVKGVGSSDFVMPIYAADPRK